MVTRTELLISAQFEMGGGACVFFVADRDGERVFQTYPRFDDAPDLEGRSSKALDRCREFCRKSGHPAEEALTIAYESGRWYNECVRLWLL